MTRTAATPTLTRAAASFTSDVQRRLNCPGHNATSRNEAQALRWAKKASSRAARRADRHELRTILVSL